MIEDTNVTAKEYRKMQKFLLLIAGCIAIDQTLLSIGRNAVVHSCASGRAI